MYNLLTAKKQLLKKANMILIHKEINETTAREKAGEMLNDLLERYGEKPILLMVSGGSAMEILDFVDTESFGKNVTITVLDERYSLDPKVNNFAKLSKTEFYRKAKERKGIDFWDTRIREGETLEGLTERFGDYIQEWLNAYKSEANGKIIITQGVGEDGHTAGIMPYPENPELFRRLFEDSKLWVVGYDAGKKNPYPLRTTVTLPFLREKVDYSIIYAVGENKREAMKRVLEKKGTLWEIPARIIHEMKNVQFFH